MNNRITHTRFQNHFKVENMFIKKEISLILVVLIILALGTSKFIDYIENNIIELKEMHYMQDSIKLKSTIATIIESKKQTTMSIALSLSSNALLEELISTKSNRVDSNNDLHQLSLKFKESKAYKNLSIELMDTQANPIAYSDAKEKSSKNRAENIKRMITQQKIINSMQGDTNFLSFTSIVPIYDKQKTFIGAIKVTIAFNTMLDELKKMDLSLLVLMGKNNTKHLSRAIKKHAISDYNLVALNVNKEKFDLIKSKSLNYFISSLDYRLYQDHLISSSKIKEIYPQQSGYYLLVKSIKYSDESIHNSLYILHLIVVSVLFLALFFVFKFYRNKNEIDKQRTHFKEIINSTSDIIIITNKDESIDVNQAFFKLFDEYETLEEFKRDYGSIGNLFENEEGFVHKQKESHNWLEYVYHHKEIEHQVKIRHKDTEHIFSIKVHALSHSQAKIYTEELYTVVLSDITKMKEYQQELESISRTDILTKIRNRESFNQHLLMELARANRHKTELSVMMFDIDDFKKINELYGESVGDDVLISIAHSIQDFLRTTDVLCRYGGDEFMIILPKVEHSGALILAERICQHIEALTIDPVGHVTVSIGFSEFKSGDSAESIVHRVDKALQQSKNSGKNCVTAI